MPKTPPNADKKTVKEPRQLKPGRYRSFHLQTKVKAADTKVPSAWKLLRGSMGVMRKNWKPFVGIIIIYGILNILLVQSFNGSGGGNTLDQTKSNLDSMNGSGTTWGSIVSSAMLFVYMASSSGNVSSSTAGAYQMILTVVTSLALIWTLREVYAGKKVRIRDGYYWGMYPMVPFILVIAVLLIQLLPVIVGGFVYNLVTQGIAATGIEMILWVIFLSLLALISLYMLSASLFAVYIVCLPNMTPIAALKSALELVRYRRWMLMRKIIFLPIFLLIMAGVVIIPFIFVAPVVASVTFLFTSMFGLPIIHGYMYRLYRELL
jgi:hypothetical protein